MAQSEPMGVLLAALAAGDRGAAEALIERTYPTVFRFLARLAGGDAALAAELTQETYRRAWAALGQFAGRSAFTTWLCRIAYNAFLDEVRRRRAAPAVPTERAPQLPAGDPAPLDAMIQDERAQRLRRAVLDLPEEQRFVVLARFWADAKVSEIARIERLSTVAVRKRLRRALAALAQALKEDAR